MKILEENFQSTVVTNIKLKMKEYPIYHKKIASSQWVNAKDNEIQKVKNSWIYKHFKNCDTREIKVLVSLHKLVPDNLYLTNDYADFLVRGSYAVINRITTWTFTNQYLTSNEVECFEIELDGGERIYIPVNHPFSEEVQSQVSQSYHKHKHTGIEPILYRLRKYGMQLAQVKYGRVKRDWLRDSNKYTMFFIRSMSPCLKLEKIKKSFLYEHFSNPITKKNKIVLYVTEIISVNEYLKKDQINGIGSHCLIMTGIKHFKHPLNRNNDNHAVQYFEIEDFSGNNRTRYMPVDHPFYEEVQFKVNNIIGNKGAEMYEPQLKKYGRELAKIKYGLIESKTKNDDMFKMSFIRAQLPCFQLTFTTESESESAV